MKKKTILITCFCLAICVIAAMGMAIVGYADFQLIGAPSAPSSGYLRTWADSSTNTIKCENSTGTACYFASSSGITLQTNGTPNGSQTLLNLVAGTNMSLIDNGSGRVTFASTASGGGGYTHGTTAAKPACSSTYAGRMYFATDSNLSYGCDGTTDQAYDGTAAVTPPGSLSSYVTLTPTGASLYQIGDEVSIVDLAPSLNWAGFYTTAATTTGSTVTAGFGSFQVSNIYTACGVGIYSSSSQGLIFGPASTSSGASSVEVYGVGTGNQYAAPSMPFGPNVRYRWRYSAATTIVPEISTDGGNNWYTPSGITASYSTSGFSHQYRGVFCTNQYSSVGSSALVDHFSFQ
jgi:hypothetical protein